eukprot:CAMPEP_0178907122 /NCGR_PEP_ID=MMETSP0786-20121207/7197_1 /TAXON_ID=186022 /ORGANISM="Thalassionema frauenfeldii, Strain CCMP 1798" /LENGTH=648 /DNA_ID=CAMNT_0020578889 /DNA_START=174 /DNA_END=2120 /DNA_ORIENTATION=+
MNRSKPLYKLGDTTSGMRRMLQRGIPLTEYIEKAVKCGTYRAPGEKPEAVEARYRKGNRFYPKEYEILMLNPPLPQPARMPKSYWRQLAREQEEPTDKNRKRLMQSYLRRNDKRRTPIHHPSESSDPIHTDDYYRKLLGIPAPSRDSTMGQKSSVVNKAYVVACRQEQLMREDGKSEEESLEIVEELLKEAQKKEANQSRDIETAVKEWQLEQERKVRNSPFDDKTEEEVAVSTIETTSTPPPDPNSVPSVLHSKPRTVQGIAIWSQRLAAIPYQQWTVGASVALDHFISRSILEHSEETWESILEGNDASMRGMGRDIVTVRKALFPETDAIQEEEDEHLAAVDADLEVKDDTEKSIDELLASLGGLDSQETDSDLWKDDEEEKEDIDQDDRIIAKLRSELQDWRKRHWEQESYDDWDPKVQDEFQTWLEGYANILMPELSTGAIDYQETRESLLAVPPLDNADKFWNSIRDEISAEKFLQGVTVSTKDAKLDTFLNTLPLEEQVRRLVNMSTLRPMLDLEGVKPQTRMAFLERHADKLIHGLELEHIVADEEGPITAQQLIEWGYAIEKAKNPKKQKKTDLLLVEPDQRFRLEKMRYDDSEMKKNYLIAWNIHKSSRARYEEFLYREGELGLRYEHEEEEEGNTNK